MLVYAVDLHQRKERHLYSMGLQNLFTRPALLIVDAASQVSWVSRQLRPDNHRHVCLERPDSPHRNPQCLLAYCCLLKQQHMPVWLGRQFHVL